MKIAIIGGKLQGTEAAALAAAAGFESILIDIDPQVPAAELADRFVCGDLVKEDSHVIAALREADMVLPANENDQVLAAAESICRREGLPFAFDSAAYAVTRSKSASDRLMHENGIPAPRYYPEGKAPYVIKPSEASGSAGVRVAQSADEVEAFLAGCENPADWVVQEYLTGPSYSIEVIGVPGNYRTYTITQIHMDDVYDCCCVTAPCLRDTPEERRFAEIACRLAELVQLHGIMDVEVIDDGEDLKVLEIDARLPSQTPLAVLKSSGMNFLSELADIVTAGEFLHPQTDQGLFASYEHYRRESGVILQEGEHMMTGGGHLHIKENFCASQWALTDYQEGRDSFCGIFICWDEDQEALAARRRRIPADLKLLP
ncbi:MAG: 3-methylornithine--L-lysine ligase PylC [Emergencia sp.]